MDDRAVLLSFAAFYTLPTSALGLKAELSLGRLSTFPGPPHFSVGAKNGGLHHILRIHVLIARSQMIQEPGARVRNPAL